MIRNKKNDKKYIGSTVDIKKRKFNHFNTLERNIHHSILLQRSYKKYGKNNFEFVIIENILFKDKDYILAREQYWLDFYQSYIRKFGFNTCRIAGNSMGVKMPDKVKKKLLETHLGKPLSDATKKKLSESLKGRVMSGETRQKISEAQKGENGYWYGKKFPEEVKEKLPNASIGKGVGEDNAYAKLNWEKVREIRKKYIPIAYSYGKLAKEYEVCVETIRQVALNGTWKENLEVLAKDEETNIEEVESHGDEIEGEIK